MDSRIKQLYQEAGELHHQAKALLDEYEGKEMPAETAEQVDRLLDQVERLTAEAKRLERTEEIGRELGSPANQLPAPVAPAPPEEEAKRRQQDLEMKAFRKVLRGDARSLTPDEYKLLRLDSDEAGGFVAAPERFVQGLLKFVDDQVAIRRLATVYGLTDAESLGIPTLETDIGDPTWTSEISTGSEDTVEPFGKRQLRPHPLARRVKISRTLIRKSSQPVETLVQQRLGYKFAVVEENAFLNGDGAEKPLGIFVASNSGIPTSRDVTCAAQTDFKADEVIDCFYSLKEAYQSRATWLVSREFIKRARKLKTADGQYLWQPGLAGDRPASILERPYIMSEFAPSIFTTGKYIAAVGDFSFYWIAEGLRMEIQILDQLYAEENKIGYIARAEVDGMPVMAEAFARLKLA